MHPRPAIIRKIFQESDKESNKSTIDFDGRRISFQMPRKKTIEIMNCHSMKTSVVDARALAVAMLALVLLTTMQVQAHFLSTAVPHHFFVGHTQKTPTSNRRFTAFSTGTAAKQVGKTPLHKKQRQYFILQDARGGAAAAAGHVVKTMTARRMETLK
jgi:hypothetical protein